MLRKIRQILALVFFLKTYVVLIVFLGFEVAVFGVLWRAGRVVDQGSLSEDVQVDSQTAGSVPLVASTL